MHVHVPIFEFVTTSTNAPFFFLLLPLTLPLSVPTLGTFTMDGVSFNVTVCSIHDAAVANKSREERTVASHAAQKRKRDEVVDDDDDDHELQHESKPSKPEVLYRARQEKQIDMLAGRADYREKFHDPCRATNEQLADLQRQGLRPVGVDTGATNIHATHDLRSGKETRYSSRKFRFV